MNIRSITLFADPPFSADDAGALHAIRTAYQAAGFAVQTTRLATSPFPSLAIDGRRAVELARIASAFARSHDIGYVSLGPAHGEWIDFVPKVLATSDTVFCGITMADRESCVDVDAIQRAAAVIRAVSTLTPDGFGNLRLAALANVPPGSPFFPAAYHAGGERSFAIAVESADLAVSACATARTATEARSALTASIEAHAARVAAVAGEVGRAHDLRFGGIDFSLAPFPELERSIGTAIERLSGGPVGSHGTLAAAALLTDAIDRARFPRCGFSGLMLPVLEDTVLAQRAAEGHLTLDDLLLMSSVCGTGLDTVPLPGDVSEEALAAILFDVAALSLRLDKPLTARLMPIPGKRAGDSITFEFPYFADGAVMAANEPAEVGLIGASPRMDLATRRHG